MKTVKVFFVRNTNSKSDTENFNIISIENAFAFTYMDDDF